MKNAVQKLEILNQKEEYKNEQKCKCYIFTFGKYCYVFWNTQDKKF